MKHATSLFSASRRLAAGVMLLLIAMAAQAQSLNVYTGNVCTAVTASSTTMPYFSDGDSVVIADKNFAVSDIDSIVIVSDIIDDNTVSVTYQGTTANVVMAGNLAPYLTATVSGANVTLTQSDDVAEEITYTAQGTTTNGQLNLVGSYKCTLVLNGVDITSAEGGAITVTNGKRIAVQLVEGTTNNLADYASGSQKACFYIKGHAEFKDSGTLNITGNAAHAYKSGEYTELKKTVGTINILAAQKDGMNIDQYLEMKGGTVNIYGVGDDGIQVSATGDEGDEYDGQVIISDGTLNVTVTAEAAKALKCDSLMTISGGTLTLTTTGGGSFDTDELDAKGSACMSSDLDINVTGGTITLTSSGTGGKGMKADNDITIDGGTINVTTTGKVYEYTYNRTTYDTSPKGIKAGTKVSDTDSSQNYGSLTINGGTITVSCSGGEGAEGLEAKDELIVNGGVIMATCYDDCLNSSNDMTINDGYIYAVSSGNDGLDANGNLYIKGGVVYAAGSGDAEVAIDANTEDQKQLYITGGTVMAFGGIESGASVSTGYLNTSYTASTNYALWSGTTLLAAFKAPDSNVSGMFISSGSMSSGSSYSLYSGVTLSGTT